MKHGADRFLRGEAGLLRLARDGAVEGHDPPQGEVLLPGSFNPVHAGHLKMLAAAEERTRRPGRFELSVVNVDKPPIGDEEVRRRLEDMRGQAPVVLTRAPTFVEKARACPGNMFLIGFDTAARLLDRRYAPPGMDVCGVLRDIARRGGRFLVAGRLFRDRFHTAEDLRIPDGWGFLFDGLPERGFREDVSSTILRAKGGTHE
ncbi:hypothetical protein [Kiritimatiella glycovorans]|uniref:Cytidyltransferase-like domain-containing protein n=1 Tax=Kiritimatiella glycovorans TaxID=1307763 RepID=A0A0G3EIU1_9BACT|nr:hypothetical protein [Kiritimatiella glycovorans]AKJ64750.1 hypothetical protein L21SP4_01505 [Kiritimatiella glycovorans]